MRKIYLLLFFTFTFLAGKTQSLYEAFAYTASDNIGGNTNASGTTNNNWTTHSNSQVGTITVLSGSLNYSGLQASTGNRVNLPGSNTTTPRDINRASGITGTPTAAYFSFLLNVTDVTQLAASHADNGYFISLGNTAGTSVTVLYARISIRSVNAGANFRLGIQNTSGTGAAYTDVTTDLTFGSTYLVVVKYDFNGASNDIATIWINPSSLGGAEPAGGTTNSSSSSTTPSTFASIALRNAANTPKADIDEIRVGDTWASVTPGGSTPTISPNPTTLTGFTYIQGSGPSTSQSFNVTASNLTPAADNIAVTGSTNYEVSPDNSAWSGSFNIPYTGGALASTPVYVRLKTGLTAGTYNGETIALAGGTASGSVTVNGSVTAGSPLVNANPTSLSGFTTSQGTASASQSFDVSGSNLTADIIVTAPTDYEVSLTSGSGYGTSVSVTQSGGTVTVTPIYVRIRASAVAGSPAGNVTVASTGATTQNVAVSGTVNPSPTVTANPTTLSGFSSTQGTASSSQSFNASGSTLTADITVTAPANYEVSFNNTTFSPSVTLTQSGGTVASTPVYVRLKAIAQTGAPSGSVTVSSAGATTQNVAVSGTVAAGPVQSFTTGNLVIYRVGDGNSALTANAAPVYLDEYTPSGILVQSILLPTAVNGSNKRITAAGNGTTEGMITRSSDSRFLIVSGYDADVATASVSGTSSATVGRTIGVVSMNGYINSTTSSASFGTSSIRSVTSTNGTDLWATGSAAGIHYTTLGSTSSSQISSTVTNLRATNIYSGQLYVSSQSGAFRLASVGTGTPTTSGETITNLPGFPTATGSPYQFFFADLEAGVAGVDVVYVADDAAGTGFQKYSLVGGNWTANGNVAVSGNSLRGLTGIVSGNSVTLYGTNGTSLVSLTDASGYNTTISGTVNVLGSTGTNTAFRGVAFTPLSPIPVPVKFTKITATQKGNNIQVDWSNATEENVVNYSVERSSNGRNFTAIGEVTARNNNRSADYSFVDASPFLGENFYRIKALETTGKTIYTNIVRINIAKKATELVLYPNPVLNELGLQFSNLPAGNYTIRVINTSGQIISSRIYSHSGGSVTEAFTVNSLTKGLYTLQVNGAVSIQKQFIKQ